MRCARCRQENQSGAKFCVECGARLSGACPACGSVVPDGAKFCPECGQPVAAAGAVAPAPGEPAAYTPRHLAEKILTSRGAIQGERKPVTVLFCDLVSSTALAERLGPDGMHALLNRFFEVALGEIHRYEGTLNQFLGDGFMALFGAPIAHEDHARRAVLAALAIRRALGEQPVAVAGTDAVEVQVRMGLNSGFVVVGAIGDNLRMDYTAVGDTTHLAARLQQLAEPGIILASEATTRLVEGHAAVECQGPVEVRGVSRPVIVYRVTGLRRALVREIDRLGLSRFVGRQRELGVLGDLLEEVARGRGRVVGLVGEPGVGKSRLLLEFRRHLAERQVTYLEGRCLSFGRSIPYAPILEMVRADCGIVDADTPEAVAGKVRTALEALRLADYEPYLLQLLGLKEGMNRLAEVDAEVIRARTIEALRQMSIRRSRERPLVLVLGDLHWVDPASEAYLASLVESLPGAAILLVGTYRPGYRPPWAERSFASQLALAPLGPEESLDLLESVLPEVRPGDPLVRLILDRGEGNPFFLEELARVVGDHAGPRASVTIPETVQGVLAARIDRLSEPAKHLVQTAAVLGREFSPRLLGALWDRPEPLAPILLELARLEFLYERAELDEPVYVFKHALTQEVALATLILPRRHELHRRAAEALEAMSPDRRPELAPVLAHHYFEAEAWREAAEHARRAAEAAQRVYANREALDRYDQALLAAERAGLGPVPRLGLLEARAGIRRVIGDFGRARADLETALAIADAAGDRVARARLLVALAELWGGHKDFQKGLDLIREAVTELEAAGERRALAAARAQLGVMQLNLGRFGDSRRELEHALALHRELGDETGQSRTLEMLAMNTWLSGMLGQAQAYADEVLRRLQATPDPGTEMQILITLAAIRGLRSGLAAAEPSLRRGLEMARAMGARAGEAYAHAAYAEIAEPFGAYRLVHQEASAALAIAREIGHLEWMALALTMLVRVHLACEDREGARRLNDEMLAAARELGSAIWLGDATCNLGYLLALEGDRAGALARFQEAARATERGYFVARPLAARADLLLAEGRADEALATARALGEHVAEIEVFIADGQRLEAEALDRLGRHDEAESLLRCAKRAAAALGAAPPHWRACLALTGLLRARGRAAEALAEAGEARTLLSAVAADLPTAGLRQGFERSTSVRRVRAILAEPGDLL